MTLKMKSYILGIGFLLLAVACNSKSAKSLQIEGTVVNATTGKVYLQKFDNKMYKTIDSTTIVDGKFSFSKDVQVPEIYGLTLDTTSNSYLLFVDENPITIKLDTASYFKNTEVSGSLLHDEFVAYKKTKGVKIDEFIKANPKSLVSAYVLYRDFSYRLSPEDISANIALLDPSLKSTPYVQVLEGLTKTLEAVSVGKQAPDFSSVAPDGKVVKFSDSWGKGYVLIDFWASWCGPCRRDNPNVVRVYQKYKDRGFDVFGVSLDKSKTAWTKAIEKDNLTWTHVSDLLFWDSAPAKLYGVRAIPANYLIDAQGKIVAKNLHGDELDKVLEDLLSK